MKRVQTLNYMSNWQIDDWRINTVEDESDEGFKHKLTNTNTGLCPDKDFDVCLYGNSPVVGKDKWLLGRIGSQYALFDMDAGKFLDVKFDDIAQPFRFASAVSERLACVKVDGKKTLFDIDAEKLIGRAFDDLISPDYYWRTFSGRPTKNWFGVQVGDKWTYYDPYRDDLCEDMFDSCDDGCTFGVYDGWAIVKVGDQYALYNPNTKTLTKQRFDRIQKPDVTCKNSDDYYAYKRETLFGETWWMVQVDGKWTLFEPNDEALLPARYDNDRPLSLRRALREHPECIEALPTRYFENPYQTQSYLGAMAEGMYERVMRAGESENLEEIYKTIEKKTQRKNDFDNGTPQTDEPENDDDEQGRG